jgi:acyl-CoA thioesterase-1
MKKTISMKIGLILLTLVIVIFIVFSFFKSDSVSPIVEREIKTETGMTIIAFGDSLTAGFGLPASEAYPALLKESLESSGNKVTMINSGVSGETTKGNLERAIFIRNQNPDLVLLGIGGNDALRALPVDETKKNMSETIDILKSGINPPVVVLLKMQSPINAGLAYKRDFDAIYNDLGNEKDILVVPFITTEVFLNRKYKLPDGLHLNKIGYQKVVDLYLLEPVTSILKQMNGS